MLILETWLTSLSLWNDEKHFLAGASDPSCATMKAVRCRIQSSERERRPGRRPPNEEKVQGRNGIADVELAVVVRVASLLAGRPGCSEEEIAERPDGIGDVDRCVLVAVPSKKRLCAGEAARQGCRAVQVLDADVI